jgi:hypothetical protein
MGAPFSAFGVAEFLADGAAPDVTSPSLQLGSDAATLSSAPESGALSSNAAAVLRHPQAAQHAMAVLMDILLAPHPPQQRRAIVNEIATGWRLPSRMGQPARGAAAELTAPATAKVTLAGTEASNQNQETQNTIERLAQRCTGVYVSGSLSRQRPVVSHTLQKP